MSTISLSYWQLLRLPSVFALLCGTGLARLAGRMFAIVIVFHALTAFGSPSLAGWIAFAAMAPGLVLSPLAGALLDRAGAHRGVAIDLALSTALVLIIAAAVFLDRAGPAFLLILATCYALTSPLSWAGVRALLPRLVPEHALDRANALDTSLYALVDLTGPSLAGALVAFAGSGAAFLAIATIYAGATACLAFVHSPPPPASGRAFLAQAWEGLMTVLNRKLLRGLALGYALNMTTWGILVVSVSVFMARQFAGGPWQATAGLIWTGAGLAGGIGALAAGQMRILGREVKIMTACMVGTALAALAAFPLAGSFGLIGLGCALAAVGLLAGPIDIGLLTLRQRRTELGQLGRVLAVSISINMAGFPIGTAVGGMLAAWSVQAAFVAAAAASLLGALAFWRLIPVAER